MLDVLIVRVFLKSIRFTVCHPQQTLDYIRNCTYATNLTRKPRLQKFSSKKGKMPINVRRRDDRIRIGECGGATCAVRCRNSCIDFIKDGGVFAVPGKLGPS